MRKPTSTNFHNEADLFERCPLAAALKLVGGRYKSMILWYVHHGIDRFGRLHATIAIVSEKMLYQQLRELERDGLLTRKAVAPRAVVYSLTPLAEDLVPVLGALESWSRTNDVQTRALAALGSEARGRRPRAAA